MPEVTLVQCTKEMYVQILEHLDDYQVYVRVVRIYNGLMSYISHKANNAVHSDDRGRFTI